MIVEVLKNCGEDLSRENLIKQATNINGLQLPLFIPGVTINISPTEPDCWRKPGWRVSTAPDGCCSMMLFGN